MNAYALPQLLDVSPVWLKELATKVKARCPSPAEDLGATWIDVLEKLILHPDATYVMRTSGESMVEYGIFDGDIALVDWAIRPRHGHIAGAKRAWGMKRERRTRAYATCWEGMARVRA